MTDQAAVWGLVGPSGTGKSHRALAVARENGLECIIDDGLLIRENRILAGTSAKREPTRMASVRRALFFDPEHAAAVKSAIAGEGVGSVLILGTSEHMVGEIAKKLGLPRIARCLYITDVASGDDIRAALNTRRQEGKHVIPVPTFALKKDFSGYFMVPLMRRLSKPGRGRREASEERTVVRPTFSYLGTYTISRAALAQLARLMAMSVQGVCGVLDVSLDFYGEGLGIRISLAVLYGGRIHETLRHVANCLRREMDRQTALYVTDVDVTATSLVVP
ncbi:MAG: hypothetical protein LBJ10_09235 [Clostridiales bacterium]|jgi:uncharacterized alkaline shock family protein YloU|nr:hypothetical protein [Clostridiales bacterium]